VLAAFLALHVVVWGAVGALSQHNLPLDVIEQLAWGREWQWTYFKHPPLPAWIIEIAAALTGGSDRALFFVGPLAGALALFLIWRLAADIVGPRTALLAALVQEGNYYLTFFAPEFNHNVVLLPLWALIGWTARRAIVLGRRRDWIFLGVAAALGMLGKYATGVLLLAIGLFILLEPGARRQLRTLGPWLGLGTMLLVLAPHIVALPGVHYGPLLFPFERTEPETRSVDHLLFPLRFARAQVLDVLLVLLLLAVAFLDRRRTGEAGTSVSPRDRRLVAVLCFGPILICMALSAAMGAMFKQVWAAPFWDFISLFVLVFVPFGRIPRISGRFLALWLLVFLAGAAAYGAQFAGQTLVGRKPLRGEFPGPELARAIDAGWHQAEGDRPLRYVAGDVWYAGNVAFYLWQERPSVLIDGDRTKSPWVKPADIVCDGIVLVWQKAFERDGLLSRFPEAQPQPEIDLSWHTWNSKPPHIAFGWAIVPPTANCGAPAAGHLE